MQKSISRKSFLKRLLATLAAPVAFMSSVFGRGSESTGSRPSAAANNCGATDRTTAGPFYISSAPETHNINYKKLSGKPMRISGTVYGGGDMRTPIAGAQVEVWHADDKGAYHPERQGDIRQFDEAEICLRGIQFTNGKGEFSFESIVPGLYGNRRRHLHWKVTAEGHSTLVTQSYWLGERGNALEKRDRTDANTEECRYVDFKVDGGVHTGIFDIVLEQNG